MGRLEVAPITLREARRFVADHHRHNEPPVGWRFGVMVRACGVPIGVGMAGRPIARNLDDGLTIEILRVCIVAAAPRNAASKAYGALNRAAAALGYRRSISYTLESEDGVSLRAAGYEPVAVVPARDKWNLTEGVNRQQRDLFGRELRPVEAKIRWERRL